MNITKEELIRTLDRISNRAAKELETIDSQYLSSDRCEQLDDMFSDYSNFIDSLFNTAQNRKAMISGIALLILHLEPKLQEELDIIINEYKEKISNEYKYNYNLMKDEYLKRSHDILDEK
jgi:hypothetical protein